jgi:hypothetical protein
MGQCNCGSPLIGKAVSYSCGGNNFTGIVVGFEIWPHCDRFFLLVLFKDGKIEMVCSYRIYNLKVHDVKDLFRTSGDDLSELA